MELNTGILTVVVLGAIELWAAVPAGFALGLNPAVTAIAAAAGAMLGGLTVLVLGKRARDWLAPQQKTAVSGRRGRIYRIWQGYGIVGLGLLAPLLTGVPLAVALGIALGAPAGRLFFWVAIGIMLWSTALTLAAALGLEGIRMLL
ncbi:MAG TPA: small multi-drug export protein [Candidatus Methanoperedenaceae archaeon]|nr:small multi-drug export protein [Candidatus Methanoperedenaceae archaeon]